MRALSVRQPYAELILRGDKIIEFRTKSTNILDSRFYLYASKHSSPPEIWEGLDFTADDVPTGVIVGSAKIIHCKFNQLPPNADTSIFPDDDYCYEWWLVDPRRLKRQLKPNGHPQPVWFNPFP